MRNFSPQNQEAFLSSDEWICSVEKWISQKWVTEKEQLTGLEDVDALFERLDKFQELKLKTQKPSVHQIQWNQSPECRLENTTHLKRSAVISSVAQGTIKLSQLFAPSRFNLLKDLKVAEKVYIFKSKLILSALPFLPVFLDLTLLGF